jgi:hypothetical protein
MRCGSHWNADGGFRPMPAFCNRTSFGNDNPLGLTVNVNPVMIHRTEVTYSNPKFVAQSLSVPGDPSAPLHPKAFFFGARILDNNFCCFCIKNLDLLGLSRLEHAGPGGGEMMCSGLNDIVRPTVAFSSLESIALLLERVLLLQSPTLFV